MNCRDPCRIEKRPVKVSEYWFFLVLVFHDEERVAMRRVGIAAHDVPKASVLVVVAEVERDAVGEPIVVEPFGLHELLDGAGLKLHELARVATARGGDAYPHRTRVDFRHPDPRRSEIPSWMVQRDLTGEGVTHDTDVPQWRVVQAAEVEGEEQMRCHNSHKNEMLSFHCGTLFSCGTATGTGAAAAGGVSRLGTALAVSRSAVLSSRKTVRNG